MMVQATRFLIIALMLAIAQAPALAAPDKDVEMNGTIGLDENFAMGVQLGVLQSEVLADELAETPYDVSSYATVLSLRGGAYVGNTHSGHGVAVEGDFNIGYIYQSAYERLEDPAMPGVGEAPASGGLHLDVDLTMIADVIRLQDNSFLPPSRLAFIAGLGVSTDFGYAYAGARTASKLGATELELELHRRYGKSYSGPNLRETRASGLLYYGALGFGAEALQGTSEDRYGMAASGRTFRGGYRMVTFNLVWVP